MDFKTEFNKGDKVWYIKNNKPVEVIILAIKIFYVGTSQDRIKYNGKDVVNPNTWLDHTDLFEAMLFRTKEELLKSL